ncbi:esterase-like activity of phytase family protein [Sphingomonas sp. H39-1-10]|uniref:esterase-like activity of phytase family protein n=1 Tax=Sphingomonas pollutisoli TaxID=3030829 RepID=UPI0023BA270E|nr:esterase-like activity of phytase family protein [Sphingomonas pollutisoli]MDF0487957.1 esterase-like activity of phytase family protein [Sphingomonas pollutisoli]
MRVVLSCLLMLLFVPDWMGEPRLPLMGKRAVVRAAPIALDAAHPARSRVGALVWLGGVRLTSPDRAFGGFSALHVARGHRVTLLSDGGNIVQFTLGPDWRPRAIAFGDLPAGPGTGWAKVDRDSESMGVDPRDGSVVAGFENSNMLWRYTPDLRRALGAAAPRAMAGWPGNEGAESFTFLPRAGWGGGAIAIGEQAPWPGGTGRAAFRFTGDPVREPNRGYRFSYIPPARSDPSDMTVLPDGRLIVLNRRFTLPFTFTNTLVVIDRGAIRPGAVVRGREIATLAPPLVHENFEGIAATREGGRTILWLVSDDNQSVLQRSLLLKFRLDAPGAPKRARP